MTQTPNADKAHNVLGTVLQPCCVDPMTGFYRDGYCNTGVGDHGVHTVCAVMTKEFLEFIRVDQLVFSCFFGVNVVLRTMEIHLI